MSGALDTVKLIKQPSVTIFVNLRLLSLCRKASWVHGSLMDMASSCLIVTKQSHCIYGYGQKMCDSVNTITVSMKEFNRDCNVVPLKDF